ncbi:MAG: ComF family protein [Paludibacteraceae bacterium]|nr:ComF family protein [Paludibacteraceae bacterium]
MAKFGEGDPMLLQQMGARAAMEWEETGFFDNIDIIVPIPLHPKRLRQRGFNQSEYIAKGLSSVLNIPMDTSHLTRSVNNRKQSQSTKSEREQLASNLFNVNHPEEWYGKTILLVDDIITTGSTVRTAIEALKGVYRCRIVVFALAKA